MDDSKVSAQEKGIWARKIGEAQHMPVLLCLGGDEFIQQFEEIEPLLVAAIENGESRPFIITSYLPQSWEKEYTPWPAPALFKKNPAFEGGAKETLLWTLESWIPHIVAEFGLQEHATEFYCMGYSLAGLCALWMLHESPRFAGCACCSGSLWFDDWLGYVGKHKVPSTGSRVYLSLGDEEANTRNQRMAQVGENTRRTYEKLATDSNISSIVFQQNRGGHFTDVATRQAKAILWLMQNL